jgi:hypothetical protein
MESAEEPQMSQLIFPVMSLVMTIPALRLIALWRRSRLAPEGFLAIFFLAFGVGIPLRLSLIRNTAVSPAWLETLNACAVVCLLTAVTSLILFTRNVFRPNSARARAFAGLVIAICIGCIGVMAWEGAFADPLHPATMIANMIVLPAFWWAFIECGSHYRKMRRQTHLGIGDPLVRNRFLLWSLWTGAFSVLPTFALGVKLFLVAVTPEGQTAVATPALLAFTKLLALACLTTAGTSIWLSFFPPVAYTAKVLGRAATTGPDAGS